MSGVISVDTAVKSVKEELGADLKEKDNQIKAQQDHLDKLDVKVWGLAVLIVITPFLHKMI